MANRPASVDAARDTGRETGDAANLHSSFQRLLARPAAERCREFRYRFAQCVIFGLPVLGLQWFGPMLSARADEAARWVPLLQAILAGWICYIGALPMLVEGLILIRQRMAADLFISAAATIAYLYSLIVVAGNLTGRGPIYRPLLFHAVVLALIAWNGLRWAHFRRKGLAS